MVKEVGKNAEKCEKRLSLKIERHLNMLKSTNSTQEILQKNGMKSSPEKRN